MEKHSSRLPFLVSLCLIFLFLGLLQTYPLARHIGSAVPYSAQPHPGHELTPLTQGDHLQLIYHLWLFKDALEEGRPFFPEDLEFSVTERERAFSPQFFPLSFIYWLFSPFGPSASYNLLILLSYILSGLAAYLLCSLFFSRSAALVGGAVFALMPFRYGQLMGGHSNGFVAFLAPLALYLLIRAFRSRRILPALVSGTAFLFLCSTDITAAYFTSFLFFPLFLLLALRPLEAWLPGPDAGPGDPARWMALLPDRPWLPLAAGGAAGFAYHLSVQRLSAAPAWFGSGLLALPFHGLLALLAWRVLAVILRSTLLPDEQAARRAASALLTPAALLLLYPLGIILGITYWGRTLAALAVIMSCTLLVIIVRRAGKLRLRFHPAALLQGKATVVLPVLFMTTLSLALIAYERQARIADSSISEGRSYHEVKLYSPAVDDYLRKDLTDAEKALYPGLAALLLAALFIAAAARGGEPEDEDIFPLEVILWGGGLASLLALGTGGEHISPFFRYLREAVPLYDLSRVPSRIFLLAAVALSLGAAGGGAVITIALSPRWRRAAISCVVLVLFMDYRPPSAPGLTLLPQQNDIYRLAAEELQGSRILDVPLWPGDSAWSSSYLYYATLYRTRTINGYSPMVPGSYFDEVFRPLEQINLGQLGETELRRLRQLQVRLLVFHEDAFPPKVSPYPAQFSVDGLLASPHLDLLHRSGPLWLFRLREAPQTSSRGAAAETVMGKIYQAEHYFRAPGKIRTEEDGTTIVDFPAGEPRSLSRRFPRKVFYPAGRYRAQTLFESRIGNAMGGLALRVLNRESGKKIATASVLLPLPGSYPGPDYRSLEDVFVLEEATPVAFELHTDGSGPVNWDLLSLVRGDTSEAPLHIEAEDLVHTGLTVAKDGGHAVQLLPERDPADYALIGPDRVYPAGSYRARLLFDRTGGGAEPAGRFEALVTGAELPLAEASLSGKNGGTAGSEEAFLSFILSRPSPLRFRVFYLKRHELLLDSIALEALDP